MKQLRIISLNCRGQTKLTLPKQLQIQDLLIRYNIDILMCQETAIDNETFELCEFIKSNYTLIQNNAVNEYGTSCLVRICF